MGPNGVIKFGTDGWRGIIAEDFTFENVSLVAQALAAVWQEEFSDLAEKVVLVGYDRRFLSGQFAVRAAEVLAANHFKVVLSDRPCSSPAISWSVKEIGAIGGVMITASHNPPEWNGFKIKASYGGSALPELTTKVEKAVKEICGQVALYGGQPIERFDPTAGYFKQLRSLVDLDKIRNANIYAVIDSMHGAGAHYMTSILGDNALFNYLYEIHTDHNPLFGGTNPEPIAPNLQYLSGFIRLMVPNNHKGRSVVGLAFDGDADRIGAIGANGEFISSHMILALMLQHLVEVKGWRGTVIKTFSTSRMVDKMVKDFDLHMCEVPIGFKNICRHMANYDVMIGGEESGGIGIMNHIPERDGPMCALLLMEIMAHHDTTLDELIIRLEQKYGPHKYDRYDMHLPDMSKKDRVLSSLRMDPPVKFAGLGVKCIEMLDGIKLQLEDGSWILFRGSGTEPLLRVYAEAPAMEKVRRLIQAGKELAEKY